MNPKDLHRRQWQAILDGDKARAVELAHEAVRLAVEVVVGVSENADQARKLNPIFERDVFGKKVLTFEGIDREQLNGLGELRTPDVADLFVAKVKGAAA